jgi:hypothetical protein
MTHDLYFVLLAVTFSATLASIVYLALATYKVALHKNDFHCSQHPQRGSANLRAVTVLKPVCGPDPNLYENLRSFCQQAHPHYQVVFGVSDPADPAIATIQRVIANVVVRPHWSWTAASSERTSRSAAWPICSAGPSMKFW